MRGAACSALVALLCVPVAASCAADAQLQPSAVLRVDHLRGATGATADLQVEPTWGERASGKALLRLTRPRLGSPQGGGGAIEADVTEAFALWHGEHVDVKLGKQIVAWGRADGINPTDNLTPRNFRVQSPYEKDQREGVAAMLVNYFPAPQDTVSLFLSPTFRPSRLPLPESGALVFEDRQPDRGRWPLGLKFDRRGDRLDWSLSYFRGYQLAPEWLAGAGPGSVILHYPKIRVFGADAAVNLGRYGWRGELARVLRDDPSQPGGARANWTMATGLDRNFDEDLNVNVQLIVQQNGTLDDVAGIVDAQRRAVAGVNAISFHQERERKFGATMRIGKKWLNGTLEAELLAYGYFQPRTSYWRPLLAYALRDDLRLSVGGELFVGRAASYFGSNRSLRGMFVELCYFH
ncbi:hypothetical protein [Massilia pseudoviolaceinigra]|uniref:hypothetical protein n=1 Tax=Massilia pseudoviolaceinigra TaxID=3057165 RepID=UPI002796B3F5|nr:hypothetical protein [Massilia sp. CCM 9206]MDQ1919277.1 hypothetical protein [Massilia sp. CCM 9206]